MNNLSLLSIINSLFPPKKLEGRKSSIEYSATEYNWAVKGYEPYKSMLPLENKVVLDAGCGLGGRTVYYSEKGPKSIVGIDIDADRIKFAKEFADYRNVKNISFLIANLTDIPFNSNHFDVIIMNDVLEHVRIDYLEKTLIELKRILKPGGRLFLEFPPWTSPFAAHLYDKISIPWCQFLFREKVLINYIESNKTVTPYGRLSYIEHFKELNRLNKKPFIKMMQKLNFLEVHFNQIIIKKLNFLKVLPIINEFATNRIVGIYTKN